MPFEQLATESEKLSEKGLAQFVFQSNSPIITKFLFAFLCVEKRNNVL